MLGCTTIVSINTMVIIKAGKFLMKVRFTIFTPLFVLKFRDLLDAAARGIAELRDEYNWSEDSTYPKI